VQIKNRQQLLVIGAIAIVALFAADKIIFTPLGNFWSARSKEIQKLETDVRNARSLALQEQSLRARWAEMRRNTLPDDQSTAEQQMLHSLERWSRETGLKVTSINPQRHDGDDYSTLQCRLEGTGGINNLAQFLYAMEKDPMALRFENIEISSHDAEGQVLSIGLQVSGLILPTQTQTTKP
jgi:Tfp pilus assembly protein PilO